MEKTNQSTLSQIKKNKMIKLIRDIRVSMNTLSTMLASDNIDKDALISHLSLNEFAFSTLLDEFNINKVSDVNNSIETNAKGNIVSLASFKDCLNELSVAIKIFWHSQGFSEIDDILFDHHGQVKISFSFAIEVSDEIKTKEQSSLENKGFIFVDNDGIITNRILDCDQNKKILVEVLRNRFPSCSILSWQSIGQFQSNIAYLYRLEVVVDVDEI